MRRKIFISFLMLLMIFVAAPVMAKMNLVSPTNDFYVADYGNVITEATKEHIIGVNKSLRDKTGAQICVVTLDSLDGAAVEDYAVALFRKFGIGDKSKNNGVLLMIAVGDRRARIEVGYGLEGRLNDGRCGSIMDNYLVPYLKKNNFDEGILNTFDALASEVSAEYGVTVDGARDPVHGGGSDDRGHASDSLNEEEEEY